MLTGGGQSMVERWKAGHGGALKTGYMADRRRRRHSNSIVNPWISQPQDVVKGLGFYFRGYSVGMLF